MSPSIFIDLMDQEPDVPRPEDRTPCAIPECPGEAGWSLGYGLAGGGMGSYLYCTHCHRILEKTQDPEE